MSDRVTNRDILDAHGMPYQSTAKVEFAEWYMAAREAEPKTAQELYEALCALTND